VYSQTFNEERKQNSVGFYKTDLRPPDIHEKLPEEDVATPVVAASVPENNPKYKFKLDWVYGCLFHPTSNYNLLLVKNDLLVYPVSMIIVIYDRINETQRHYTDHTDLIQCLSVCGEFVVSGQKSGKFKKARAQVRLWNLETLETLQVFNENGQT
jgi:hypothetical protein